MTRSDAASPRALALESTVDGSTSSGGRERGAVRIGRFAVLERIGAGGMGEVYAAYDEQLDRKVALKVVHAARGVTPENQARLLREARALAQLSHPNVVTVYDAGIHEGEVFIAMEFVRGRTLRAWLGEAPRAWGEILAVFVGLAEGLAALHALGLVHRDIKPDNVLLDESGRPRLVDFGLARAQGEAAGDGETSASDSAGGLTRTGALAGTPSYMSPEQFEGRPATARSDQFSLCVTLYEALHGRAPFAGDTPLERASAVLQGAIQPPPESGRVPAELSAVIARGLQRDPQARWPDMTGLLAALRAVMATFDREIEDPTTRRSLATLTLLLLVALLAVPISGAIVDGGVFKGVAPASAVISDVSVLVATGAAAWATRASWWQLRYVRRFVWFFFLILTIYLAQDFAGWLAGRSTYHSMLANSVCLTMLLATPLFGVRLGSCSAWAAVFTALMIADPVRYFLYFYVANVGAMLLAGLVIRRPPIDAAIGGAQSQVSRASASS